MATDVAGTMDVPLRCDSRESQRDVAHLHEILVCKILHTNFAGATDSDMVHIS